MRTESADYSSSPPELTDSEDEYDLETDAEDSGPAERHPSGSTSSAITSSISSYKRQLPGRFNVSKTIIKDKPVSDIDIKSSDIARERLCMHRGSSKDASRNKVQTKLFHPSGTCSPVKRTKQCTDASEVTGKNMVREEGSPAPDTMIDSKAIHWLL